MTPTFKGRIVEWDREKGCGWLDAQGQRIFLHIKDFAVRHRRPEVGDEIRFVGGTDAKGRLCATAAEHINDGGRFTERTLRALLGLLLFPTVALFRLPLPPWMILAYALFISLVTYAIYARDKRCARAKQRRTPESGLHFLELAGGWPGAFVAQRRLRHKCSKLSYQIGFWLIVMIYQLATIDFLFDWRISQAVLARIPF